MDERFLVDFRVMSKDTSVAAGQQVQPPLTHSSSNKWRVKLPPGFSTSTNIITFTGEEKHGALLADSLAHFVPVQSVDFSPCLLVSSCNNILMLPECLLQTPASVILLLEVNLLFIGSSADCL